MIHTYNVIMQVRAPQKTLLKLQSPTGSLNVCGIDGVYFGGREVNISSASSMNLFSQVYMYKNMDSLIEAYTH